ncbi:MAG: hypothetical protein WCP74_04105 [Sphingobacteriia bacterium]|jgi:hypothetical protein
METLNNNERQGKSSEGLADSYKMMGLSLLFFTLMIAYVSLNEIAKIAKTQLEVKGSIHLLKKQ